MMSFNFPVFYVFDFNDRYTDYGLQRGFLIRFTYESINSLLARLRQYFLSDLKLLDHLREFHTAVVILASQSPYLHVYTNKYFIFQNFLSFFCEELSDLIVFSLFNWI